MAPVFDHPLAWRLLGAAAFNLTDASAWQPHHYALWALVIAGAMELLARLVLGWGALAGYDAPARQIRPGGKPLDVLERVDLAFIACSKLLTAAFTYHAIRYAWTQEAVVWPRGGASGATVANTLLALPLLYVVYDLFYTFFHRALHHPSVYAYVHKHHHRQVVPARGNTDAINVHPFEFVCGEYNHLLAVHLVGALLKAVARSGVLPPDVAAALGLGSPAAAGVHVGTAAFFIVFGGVLASLNHTRFDLSFGGGLFSVAYHDVHHHLYRFNYGQYIMLWDWLGGSFRAPSAAAPAARGKQL
jgi:sterol desaturase/sphingolipid hydroxylase (fatty acid hydroxylase superfamily)